MRMKLGENLSAKTRTWLKPAHYCSGHPACTSWASVLGEVDNQVHITFSSRSAFWEKLKISDLLPNLCTSLKGTYITAYTSCAKGKDKYMSFQLEWYGRCSYLLQDSTPDTTTDSPRYTGDWWSFRSDCLKQIKHSSLFPFNAVMTAVQSAVYD